MNEQDILNLIKEDVWMMGILRKAEEQNLKDWLIGAGFVRSKVWNHLHGYQNSLNDISDIDLVYFDKEGNGDKEDRILSEKLESETSMPWEIKNQFYAHKIKNLKPFESTLDAISKWPETATAIGVTLTNGKLTLTAPYGIDDLVNMVIKPCPKFSEGIAVVKQRVEKKKWLEKWPKLRFEK